MFRKNDIKCLKHPNFLKLLYRSNDKIFSSFLTRLSREDDSFTMSSCSEIIKIIDEISTNDDNELVKLFIAVKDCLNIKDSYQMMRFELIIGYPQIIVNEPINSSHIFPLFGINKFNELDQKYFDYRGLINSINTSCFMKKIYSGIKTKVFIELFLEMLLACTYNHSFLKYLYKMPSEDTKSDE